MKLETLRPDQNELRRGNPVMQYISVMCLPIQILVPTTPPPPKKNNNIVFIYLKGLIIFHLKIVIFYLIFSIFKFCYYTQG